MDSANGTQPPRKLRVTETDLNQVSQELNRAVGKESTCKQNALVAASADRQAKALLEAATRNRQKLEARYSEIVDRLGEQSLEQLSKENGLDTSEHGKLSPAERATAVAQGEATQRKFDPFEERGNDPPRKSNIEIGGDVAVSGTIGRLAADVANRLPADSLVRIKGKPHGVLMKVIEAEGDDRRVRILEGQQALEVARFPVSQLEQAEAGTSQRMRIDDVAGQVEKGGKVEALDKAEDKPRRRFEDLSSAEQEAAEMLDGDENPRWKLPTGELVDSNLADGRQPDKTSIEASFRAKDTTDKPDSDEDDGRHKMPF